MKIVFMGTPDYAVKTLEKLIEAGHEIAAVYAQPDKPVGRKHILTAPPVKVCAENHGIPVFQPDTLRDGVAAEQLKEIAPDVIVVVAYGKILPKEILTIAKYGCINGHASLLPKYRGASPIQWCIVCGEEKTGVTTMYMDEGMDTGDILEQTEVLIGENETAEELFERLSEISAELMVSTLEKAEKGELKPQKQVESEATYAPIIKKEMAFIDFKAMTAKEVFNAVRGYYSWPCAYFMLDDKRIKVIKTAVGTKSNSEAGSVADSSQNLAIVCADGVAINLLEIQPEGKSAMSAKQFLNGKKIAVGSLIGEENAKP